MKIPFKDRQSKEISITAVCTLFPWKPHLFIRVYKTITKISLHTDMGHWKRPQSDQDLFLKTAANIKTHILSSQAVP